MNSCSLCWCNSNFHNNWGLGISKPYSLNAAAVGVMFVHCCQRLHGNNTGCAFTWCILWVQQEKYNWFVVSRSCDGTFTSFYTNYGDVKLVFACLYSTAVFSRSACEASIPYTSPALAASTEEALDVFGSLQDILPAMWVIRGRGREREGREGEGDTDGESEAEG